MARANRPESTSSDPLRKWKRFRSSEELELNDKQVLHCYLNEFNTSQVLIVIIVIWIPTVDWIGCLVYQLKIIRKLNDKKLNKRFTIRLYYLYLYMIYYFKFNSNILNSNSIFFYDYFELGHYSAMTLGMHYQIYQTNWIQLECKVPIEWPRSLARMQSTVGSSSTSAAKYCPVARCLKRNNEFQWPAPPRQGSCCTTSNFQGKQ